MAIHTWRETKEAEVLASGFGKEFVRRTFMNPISGKTEEHFHFRMKKGGGVATLVVTVDLKVVLVREYMQGIGRVHLWMGGGLPNQGETPGETARREVLEETGHQTSSIVELGNMPFVPRHCPNEVTLLLATGCTKVGEQSLDANHESSEEVEIVYMPLGEFIAKVMSGEIDDPFTAVALIRSLTHLHYHIVPQTK